MRPSRSSPGTACHSCASIPDRQHSDAINVINSVNLLSTFILFSLFFLQKQALIQGVGHPLHDLCPLFRRNTARIIHDNVGVADYKFFLHKPLLSCDMLTCYIICKTGCTSFLVAGLDAPYPYETNPATAAAIYVLEMMTCGYLQLYPNGSARTRTWNLALPVLCSATLLCPLSYRSLDLLFSLLSFYH